LLTDDKRPLEAAAALFQRTFAKADHFRVATALCLLIQDRAISLPQRMLALFILFDLYKSEVPGNNPFLPVFLEEVCSMLPSLEFAHEPNPMQQKLHLQEVQHPYIYPHKAPCASSHAHDKTAELRD
jgi:hypothetical protein